MDARSLTELLGGTWYRSYGTAFCPAHENRRTPALSIRDGDRGGVLLKCHAGCAYRDIRSALEARGLNPSAGQRQDDAPEQKAASDHMGVALRIWRDGKDLTGTLSEAYLRSRGIKGLLPLSLRHGASVWHPGLQDIRPALLAAINLEGTGVIGIQRTWLEEPGRKLSNDLQRAMLGPAIGGAVRVKSGFMDLYVAEGIETALSLEGRFAKPKDRIWAALSTSGVAGLKLPSKVKGRLFIAPDGDEAGIAAAETLAERAREAGWPVKIIDPPGPGNDWNDVQARREP